jgi:hypothetical protein
VRHPNVHANRSQQSICSCPSRPVESPQKEDSSTLLVHTRFLSGRRIESSDRSQHRGYESIALHGVACRLEQIPVGIQYWDGDAKELQSPSDETAAVPCSFCLGDIEKQVGESGPAT